MCLEKRGTNPIAHRPHPTWVREDLHLLPHNGRYRRERMSSDFSSHLKRDSRVPLCGIKTRRLPTRRRWRKSERMPRPKRVERRGRKRYRYSGDPARMSTGPRTIRWDTSAIPPRVPTTSGGGCHCLATINLSTGRPSSRGSRRAEVGSSK